MPMPPGVCGPLVTDERFNGLGYEVIGSTPADFGKWLRDESARWGKLIRERNITAE